MITDEAVEAAAKAMVEHKDMDVTFGDVARAALEAAAPHLMSPVRDLLSEAERLCVANGAGLDFAVVSVMQVREAMGSQ